MAKTKIAIQMYDQVQRIRKAIFEVLIRDYSEVMEDLNTDKYVTGMTFEHVFTVIEATEQYFLDTMNAVPEGIERAIFKEHLRGKDVNKRFLERLYKDYREGTLDLDDLLDKHKPEE